MIYNNSRQHQSSSSKPQQQVLKSIPQQTPTARPMWRSLQVPQCGGCFVHMHIAIPLCRSVCVCLCGVWRRTADSLCSTTPRKWRSRPTHNSPNHQEHTHTKTYTAPPCTPYEPPPLPPHLCLLQVSQLQQAEGDACVWVAGAAPPQTKHHVLLTNLHNRSAATPTQSAATAAAAKSCSPHGTSRGIRHARGLSK